MALFDFFRRQLAAHRSNPLPQSRTVVPDGHLVTVYEPSPVRGLRQSTGCICIVDQGRRGDNPVAEMERLLREVGDLIRGDRPRVLLASLTGRVSELFAPNDPAVDPLAGLILWVLNPALFVDSSLGPLLLQMLLREVYTLGSRRDPPFGQCVFVPEFTSPPGRLIAELLSQLGIQVRETEPETQAVLVEVQRPEGVILSALPGRVFVPTQGADPYIRRMNEEKDRANEQGDIVEQQRLEALELDGLARRLRCTRSSCYR